MNRMSMPSWDRIKAVFAEACELPGEQVPAFLDRVCEGDAELRREVDSLLAARSGKQVATGGAARELAAASTMRAAVITEGAGTIIGPYKLLQLIGEGGFGSVFLAEQTQPVRRRVAVKIIKLGMDTKQVIARFEAERQALALMDHPHIAKVLDGGATPLTERGGGRPYFVMEYVVGDAITAFADAHKLTIRDRLDLFQQVCSAVQHAHTKGIIHRDLKPGNVLVTMVDGKPFAKVIDFGIAKATAGPGGLTDKTLFTEHRQLIGTPEYMSPEQAQGSPDIDTRTDVYALGVLLYELLTGETPFDGARLRSAAYAEIQRIIKDEEPPSPSQRLSRSLDTIAATAAARQLEPDKLRASVHGELDWIVMRALDKERGRRYESASSLADDVRRHLAGEAVVAAPVSNTYRLRKFVRKNRGPVVAVSAVVCALLGGVAGTTWGMVRANRATAELAANLQVAREAVVDIIVKGSLFDASDLRGTMEAESLSESDAKRSLAIAMLDGSKQVRRDGVPGILEPTPSEYSSDVGILAMYASVVADSLMTERDTLARQKTILTSALEDLYKPGTVIQTNAQATGWGILAGLRAREDYKSVPEEDRAVWEVAETAKFMTFSYSAQLDAAEWSAYTANLALAQAAIGAGDYPEARKRLARAPESKRGWDWYFADQQTQHIVWCVTCRAMSLTFSLEGTTISASQFDDKSPVYLDVSSGNEVSTTHSAGFRRTVATWSAAGLELTERTGSAWPYSNARSGEIRLLTDIIGSRLSTELCAASFSPDGSRVAYYECSDGKTLLCLVNTLLWGGPERTINESLAFASFSAGGRHARISYNEHLKQSRLARVLGDTSISGLTITTPDGTRRIVGGADKTVRFYEANAGKPTLPAITESPDGVYREVAVFRMPEAVTNLQMTGDGTRLIIHLEGGSARVWDIRDPEERRKDLQAEWAERVPAGAYLDTLWATDTPDDKLRDAVINDASLTPLRRLVAVEMLEERVEDDRLAVEQAFAAVTKDQTDKSAVQAAAAARTDLPKRVHAQLIAKAAEWEYKPAESSDAENLAEEVRRREQAEQDAKRLGEAILTETADLLKGANLGIGFSQDASERFRMAARLYGAVFGHDDERALATTAWAEIADLQSSDTEPYETTSVADAINRYESKASGTEPDAMRVSVALSLVPRYRQAMKWLNDHLDDQVADDGFRRNIGMLCMSTHLGNMIDWKAKATEWSPFLQDVVLDCDAFAAAPAFNGLWIDQEFALLCGALASLRQGELAEAGDRLVRATTLRNQSLSRPAEVAIAWDGREKGPHVLNLVASALLHHHVASATPVTLLAVGEVDMKADPTLKAPLTADEHRQRAREALARAKALMQPAADGTPSPWANDEDAKVLIAEAEGLIGGAP